MMEQSYLKEAKLSVSPKLATLLELLTPQLATNILISDIPHQNTE
jgi:hypothetical protein